MVTNISILANVCSDEIKKMNRELQRLMLGQLFAECLVFMNYILYLRVRLNGDRGLQENLDPDSVVTKLAG